MKPEVAKLLKSRDVYEARSEEAAEKKACTKPTRHKASEKERALGAVYKRLEAEETRMYAAESEEASEMRDSQECILSGGVYLRHRRSNSFLPAGIAFSSFA